MSNLEFKKLDEGESPYAEITFANTAKLKVSIEPSGPWRDLFKVDDETTDSQLEARLLFEIISAVKDYLTGSDEWRSK